MTALHCGGVVEYVWSDFGDWHDLIKKDQITIADQIMIWSGIIFQPNCRSWSDLGSLFRKTGSFSGSISTLFAINILHTFTCPLAAARWSGVIWKLFLAYTYYLYLHISWKSLLRGLFTNIPLISLYFLIMISWIEKEYLMNYLEIMN